MSTKDNTMGLVLVAVFVVGVAAYFTGAKVSDASYNAVEQYVLNDQIKAQADITSYACTKHTEAIMGKATPDIEQACAPATVHGFMGKDFTRKQAAPAAATAKDVEVTVKELQLSTGKKQTPQ